MLVLSRKVGESIKVGDGITVLVQRIAGNRVSLAIDAPDEVKVMRGELKLFDPDRRGGEANGEVQ